MAPLCFGFGWVCSPLGGIGFRTQNGAKANAATAGSRGGKAIGNALRGTGREASKFAKRLDSGQKRKERQEKLGRGAHKMRKRRSREKAPLCFGFGYVFVVGGIGYGRLHGGKANAETAGTRSDKANGSALREAWREAGKTKRVNSASGWTADKSGKNDKRSGRGTFGRRLHGGKGAAKCRRSGTARDHKRSGKKSRKSGCGARKQGGKKSGDRAGREATKGKRFAGRESALGKRWWRKIPFFLW